MWLLNAHIFTRELQLLNSTFLTLTGMAVLLVPMFSFLGYGFPIDLNTRLNANDAYVGTYYFWWTNLTYLPLFFFLLLVAACYAIGSTRRMLQTMLVPLLLMIYSVELSDYLSLNVSDSASLYGFYGANTLLTNTLNSYHPFVFYLSCLLLTATWVVVRCFTPLTTLFNCSISLMQPTKLLWFTVYVNLTALWMGSWWALQEGTWGGWWNWDPSEMFGLLFTFASLSLLHTANSYSTALNTRDKFTFLWLTTLMGYFFMQLNFDLVSHNFGSKFFFFFNNNLFFLEALTSMLLLCVVVALSSVVKFRNVMLYNTTVSAKTFTCGWAVRLLPSLVALSWLVWSYSPLANYFLWNFLEINVLNFETSLQPTNLLAALILTVWLFGSYSMAYSASLVISLVTLNWLWMLLLSLVTTPNAKLLHPALLLIALLNLALFGTDLTFWAADMSSNFHMVGNSIELLTAQTLTSDSCAWESTYVHSTALSSNSDEWNLFTFSNAPAINYFNLAFSQNYFSNFYNLGDLYAAPTIHLELPLIGTVNGLFWFVLYRLTSSQYTHYRIKNF